MEMRRANQIRRTTFGVFEKSLMGVVLVASESLA